MPYLFIHSFKVFTFQKEAIVFRASFNSHSPCFGTTCTHFLRDHLKNEANTVIHAGGNVRVKKKKACEIETPA